MSKMSINDFERVEVTAADGELAAHVEFIKHKAVKVLPGVGVKIETGEVIERIEWDRVEGRMLYTARFA